MVTYIKKSFDSIKCILNDPCYSLKLINAPSTDNLPIMNIGEMIIAYCFGKMALGIWVGISVVKLIPNEILTKDMPPGMAVLIDNVVLWLVDGFLHVSYVGFGIGMLIVGPYFYLTTYKDKKLKLSLKGTFSWVYYFSIIISFFASILAAMFMNIIIGLKYANIISPEIAHNSVLIVAHIPACITYTVVFILSFIIIKYISDENIFYTCGLFIGSVVSYYTLPCIFLKRIKRFITFLIDVLIYICGFGGAIILFMPYRILARYWKKNESLY